jgi:hypothetical protein
MANSTKKTKEAVQVSEDTLQFEQFTIPAIPSKAAFSRTIEIYDALPKYVWSIMKDAKDIEQSVITRKAKISGILYNIKISAAIMDSENGKIFKFPGEREEHIEDALRKIAVTGSIRKVNGEAGVVFTLYELFHELKTHGHTYSLSEIKDGIDVLNKSTLEIASQSGEDLWRSAYFPRVGITTRSAYIETGGDAKCYVQFYPLVNQSIIENTYRRFNYAIATKIKSNLARYMYKRMSHYWKQAGRNQPYTPKLVTFLEQSPRGLSELMRNNTRAMREALKSLIVHKVIASYDENTIKKGRSIIDVEYTIWPHPDFIEQAIRANREKQEIETALDAQKYIDDDNKEY